MNQGDEMCAVPQCAQPATEHALVGISDGHPIYAPRCDNHGPTAELESILRTGLGGS